ncbi:MAG: DUF1934 domain-containing protein [Lachnospiraceae bacterium]|nr:DUF1934 domain-containing protein [Lachnospiraceae bacterium]
MTKDVLLSICGVRHAEESDEPVEVITTGKYYNKNGKHYVTYDLVHEDDPFSSERYLLKLSQDRVDVMNNGDTHTHMVFEKGECKESAYMTPFGEMHLGLETDEIDYSESPESIRAAVSYRLFMNYEHVSDCEIVINVRSKDADSFRL